MISTCRKSKSKENLNRHCATYTTVFLSIIVTTRREEVFEPLDTTGCGRHRRGHEPVAFQSKWTNFLVPKFDAGCWAHVGLRRLVDPTKNSRIIEERLKTEETRVLVHAHQCLRTRGCTKLAEFLEFLGAPQHAAAFDTSFLGFVGAERTPCV
jgi:hypothetical protein